jgi:N-acyl-D-aspartate/D-glutamate deacylase
LATLLDPGERARLDELAQRPGPVRHLANWAKMVIVETFQPSNKPFEGMTVGEIASSLGKRPFDALLDIACADELLTTFALPRPHPSPDDRKALAEVLNDPRAVVGGSDAGAHLDMLATFNFATRLLEETRGDEALLTLEAAVHQLTERPAQLYGLVDRGRVAAGAVADLVLFDPVTVGSGPVHTVADLPGGAARLFASAEGVAGVFVNGTQIVDHGAFTDERPGSILRSGTDTRTPALND